MLCFKRIIYISNFLYAFMSSISIQILLFNLPPHSRDGIIAMYHGQVMLVPVLTVKRNEPVTLSKQNATRMKREQKHRK